MVIKEIKTAVDSSCMNSKRHIAIRNIVLSFLMSVLCGCAAGHLPSDMRAEVGRMHVSSYELPNHAKRIFISPGGILEVETTESEGAYKNGEGQRTLIDLHSMTRIWSGPLQEGYMISDAPSPIIVKKSGSKHMVVRYDRNGQILWQATGKGLFVFGLGVEEDGMLLLLSLQQSRKDTVHAIMNCIRLDDGKDRWQTDLGVVSLNDDEIGSLWRYTNRPIFAHSGKAFLLLENRAICMTIKNGKVRSDWQIPRQQKNTTPSSTIWLPLKKDVIVVSGAHVILMSEDKGTTWHVSLDEMNTATEALLCNQNLIVAFSGKDKRGVGVLDIASRSWRWKTSDKAYSGTPPKGLVAVGNTIVVASRGCLHGFDGKTGDKLYIKELPKKVVRELLPYDTNMILICSESIECRRVSNGELIWSKDKLGTPLALYYSKRRSSMASIQATMQGMANISANMSRSYYGMANQKIGGSYAYDPWSRTQYTRLSQSAGRSAAASEFGASVVGAAEGTSSFIDHMVSIIVDMQNETPSREWSYFVVPLKSGFINYQTNTAKLMAIRLSDGSTREIPLQEASMTCIPTAMVSEELGLIIEAYNKFPFCEQSQTIDVFRLPDAF